MTTPTFHYTRPQTELRCEDAAPTDTIRRDTWTLHVLNDAPEDARVSVVIDACRAPTIVTDDGDDEPNWGNADFPSDLEVSAAASEALGRTAYVLPSNGGGERLDEMVYDVAAPYQDTSLFPGIVEFEAHGERYRFRDCGAGLWSRHEWDADNFGGGRYIRTGLVSAPSGPTPRQLDAATSRD